VRSAAVEPFFDCPRQDPDSHIAPVQNFGEMRPSNRKANSEAGSSMEGRITVLPTSLNSVSCSIASATGVVSIR